MSMKKSLLAVVAAFCLAAMPVTASAESFSAEDASKIVNSYIEKAEEIQYIPIRPADISDDGSIFVSKLTIDLFGCLVLQCSDYEALEGTTLGTFPINIGEETDSDDGSVMIWPYERYVEHVRQWVNDIDSILYGADRQPTQSEGLYIVDMSSGEDDMNGFISAILADERFELKGLACMHYEVKTSYAGEQLILRIEEEPGCILDEDSFDTPEYLNLSLEEEGYYLADESVHPSFEEATALCEKIEARDDVSFAWLVGDYRSLSDEDDVEECWLHYIPFHHYGSGDIDQNGRLSISDAILLTRYTAENLDEPLKEEALAEADINGDDCIDALDLSELLKLLA